LADRREQPANLIYSIFRHTFVHRGRPGFPLHDPLAVGVAAFPDLVTTEDWGVTVETGTGDQAGRTCRVMQESTPVHKVAVGVRTDEFIKLFRETLSLV